MIRNTLAWLIVLLLLSACQGNKSYDLRMQQADSLMEQRALLASQAEKPLLAASKILDSLRHDSASFTQRQLMRYQLLRVKLHNKQNLSLAHDTIMTTVADYYRRHGSPNEQVEALYLMGRVYHDQGRLPQAIDLYQQADQAADTTRSDCNFWHLFLVHSQLSEIYTAQRMPQRDFKELEQMEKYAWRARDTLYAILSVFWREGPYWNLGQYDKAVKAAEEGRKLLVDYGYEKIANGSSSTIIWYLLKRGKTAEAKQYMDKYEHEAGVFDSQGNIEKGRESYYALKGNYYLQTNKLDSAEMFFRKVIQYDGPRNNIEGGYEGLMQLYARKLQTDSVVKFASLYCEANEKDLQSKSSEKLEHIQSMYDYSQYKKDAEIKDMQATRTRLYASVVVLFLTVVVFILAYILYIYRKKARRKLEEKNLQYAETYRQYTKLLREQKGEKRNRNIQEQEKLEKEISKLTAIIANHQNDKLRPERWNLEASVLYSEEVVSMHQYAVKGTAPDTLWSDLWTKAQLYLPEFMNVIQTEKYALSDLEQQVALLLKLRFLGVEIQNLLGKSSQSITNIRANINRKLFRRKGVKGLDEGIHSLGESIRPLDM